MQTTLVGKIETIVPAHGLSDEPITIRMTGCPNGCARPRLHDGARPSEAGMGQAQRFSQAGRN